MQSYRDYLLKWDERLIAERKRRDRIQTITVWVVSIVLGIIAQGFGPYGPDSWPRFW